MYRWHEKYPLGTNPLARISGPTVLETLRRFAQDAGLYQNALTESNVLSIDFLEHMDRHCTKLTASLRPMCLVLLPVCICELRLHQENGISTKSSYKTGPNTQEAFFAQ